MCPKILIFRVYSRGKCQSLDDLIFDYEVAARFQTPSNLYKSEENGHAGLEIVSGTYDYFDE